RLLEPGFSRHTPCLFPAEAGTPTKRGCHAFERFARKHAGVESLHQLVTCSRHQSRHIPLYASSMCRAKRLPSMSGDRCMRSRNEPRRSWSLDKSPAQLAANSTYCSGVCAVSSSSPRLHNWLKLARPMAVLPRSVTVGTPIQKASRVVVCPLHGT